MRKRSQWRRRAAVILIFLCGLVLSSCASVQYYWYTQPDRSIKLSVKADKVQRMLVITNVSQLESIKLDEEKTWLEELGAGDYFEIQQYPDTFFLAHYTDSGKGGVVFYNFNFAASDFDPAKEDVTAILDHFGLTESLNRKTKSISLKTLTSSQACRFHALFETGDFQQLKKPEWFEERWQSN